MTRSRFEVIYEAGSRCTTILMLYGGTESEAKAELYRRGVPRNREIIILSIRPCWCSVSGKSVITFLLYYKALLIDGQGFVLTSIFCMFNASDKSYLSKTHCEIVYNDV